MQSKDLIAQLLEVSKFVGWNPWAESLVKFTKHLDSLTTTKVYETLAKHQEAITF